MIATVSTTDTDLTLQADRPTWEALLTAVPRSGDRVEHQAWTAISTILRGALDDETVDAIQVVFPIEDARRVLGLAGSHR